MEKRYLLSLLLTVSLKAVLADDILVTTSDGTILGQQLETFTNQTFYSFQKIPFAAPPVGELRFQSPIPPEKWEGVLDTSGYLDVKCFQTNSDEELESEDCLYLNVYTPQLPNEDNGNDASLPTLLYIFGGAFLDGNVLFEQVGPQFFIDEGVIVITFNYRVGVFGFLSTGDTVVPGNAGLKDQLLAIQWAHDNIQAFGGDPDKITIVGISSGAASVAYQLLHTESEGLFRAAVLESGSCLSPWSLQRDPKMYTVLTAGQLDDTFVDNSTDSETLLEFLQSVPAQDLDVAARRVNDWASSVERQAFLGRTYAPVIEVEHDGAFLTEKMYGKAQSGDFVQVPILAGFNSLEAIGEAADIPGLQLKMLTYDQHLDWLVPEDMRIEDIENRTDVGQRIRNIYTKGGSLENNLLGGVQFISDNRYTRPVRKFAELFSSFVNVYFYQFSYDGVLGGYDITVDGVTGVAHAENFNYMWHFRVEYGGIIFDNADFDMFPEADITTLKRMVRLWSNFVKSSNPTPDNTDELLQHTIWPTVSSGGAANFLSLDIGEELVIFNKPKDNTYRAWNTIYDSLGYDDFDTY